MKQKKTDNDFYDSPKSGSRLVLACLKLSYVTLGLATAVEAVSQNSNLRLVGFTIPLDSRVGTLKSPFHTNLL